MIALFPQVCGRQCHPRSYSLLCHHNQLLRFHSASRQVWWTALCSLVHPSPPAWQWWELQCKFCCTAV